MSLSQEQQQQWQDNGYLLLKNFHSNDQIKKLNEIVSQLWKSRAKLDARYVIDIFVGTDREQRVYFNDAPKDARSFPYKLNDLFLSNEEIRQAVAGEKIAPVLSELLGGFPMICNSLNFEFGSQQPYHFDTFYMPSPTPNKMVASWLALEDATDQNGPLAYYPGSHKIPPYKFSNGTTVIIEEEMESFDAYMTEQIAKFGLRPEVLLANKGDLLIWHSQLFHGGSEITDKSKTRKSLVTHYFTKEDFPDLQPGPPNICAQSCYMDRPAQPVGYEYTEKKSGLLQRIFG